MAVFDGLVLVGRMTLQAHAVTRSAQLGAVRLVAITAGDAGRKHLALLERTVIVDFIEHLSVRLVESPGECGDVVGFGKPAAWNPVLGKCPAARVTEAAGLDFLAQRLRPEVARSVAGLRVDKPSDVAPFIELHEQSHARVVALAERPPALPYLRAVDMPRTLPMAAFAAHTDLREGRGEAIVRCVIVLAHAGRMAFRAHEVPVLIQFGPVQDVVVLDLLIRIEVEPALAACGLRPAVPGQRQGLYPSVGKLDEILLQWVDAERVLDLEDGERSIGSVGLDEELSVLAEETGVHAVIVEARLVEIAEDRLLGRMSHCLLVLGTTPQLCLGTVAAGAGLAADKGGRGFDRAATPRAKPSFDR